MGLRGFIIALVAAAFAAHLVEAKLQQQPMVRHVALNDQAVGTVKLVKSF